MKFDVAIIGGGPAGALAALQLTKSNFKVCLIEQKRFPRETLCGEFLSKEVVDKLKKLDLFDKFLQLNPNKIESFKFVNNDGNFIKHVLPFSAYGIKRSSLDLFLLKESKNAGAIIFQPAKVLSVEKNEEIFTLRLSGKVEITSSKVIGAFGKRSILDTSMARNFIKYTSNLSGIKFHLDKKLFRDFSSDEILIFADNGIYCGLNQVNENKITVCFLIDSKENSKSPKLELISFIKANSEFSNLFNGTFEHAIMNADTFGAGNIYFGKKELVKDGIFMIGDAAGVISPLAGDGIAMAVESSELITNLLVEQREKKLDWKLVERKYIYEWENLFNSRLRSAKIIQFFIMKKAIRHIGFLVVRMYPKILLRLIQMTRQG